jgi:hypothetical protein
MSEARSRSPIRAAAESGSGSGSPRNSRGPAAARFASFVIGDCLGPRTAEEAVLEGLQAGLAI